MANSSSNSFHKGLITGLLLQIGTVGPVFFFIANLVLQRTIADGLAGALAVTLVDYFYITLSILGVGALLERPKLKRRFGFISSIVLVIFGAMMVAGTIITSGAAAGVSTPATVLASFWSVFLLTISSPMTIVFFTSWFAAKAVEYNFAERELVFFGIGTGLATPLFMGVSVLVLSLVRGAIPAALVVTLNLIVGLALIGYGGARTVALVREIAS